MWVHKWGLVGEGAEGGKEIIICIIIFSFRYMAGGRGSVK